MHIAALDLWGLSRMGKLLWLSWYICASVKWQLAGNLICPEVLFLKWIMVANPFAAPTYEHFQHKFYLKDYKMCRCHLILSCAESSLWR